MAASPSPSPSPSAAPGFAVWVHDVNGTRVALVDVPVLTGNNANPSGPYPASASGSLPLAVSYLGNTYVWSNVFNKYIQVTPTVVTGDLGSPVLSVLCNPQY